MLVLIKYRLTLQFGQSILHAFSKMFKPVFVGCMFQWPSNNSKL